MFVQAFLSVLFVNLAYGINIDAHIKVIQNYVNSTSSYKSIADICASNKCCSLGSEETCSYAAMPKNENTFVLPGGNTRCIYSDSTPYAFQVIPGDKDKLVVYFQGGGACWDRASTALGLCTSDISVQKPNGIFDRTEKLNRYKDYTVIVLAYCSGDVFVGDTTRPYRDSKGLI